MIDRYHLRYFLSVVDCGNFSRAAAACNVSQPTLSVGIAKMEAALGRPLFNRSNRRVELTEAGVRLLSRARKIEGEFAAAEREVAGTVHVQTFRLGVLSTVPRRWTEHVLRECRTNPGPSRVEVIEGGERDLRSRLGRGRIDAALMIIRDDGETSQVKPIVTEGYSLALSISHPLASRPSIRAEDLADEPMIIRRHCELLSETSRFFTAHGVRPFFPARTTSDDKALSYVRTGLGVTVMPDGFREPGVARVPLHGFDPTRCIGLFHAEHVEVQPALHDSIAAALFDVSVQEDD